MTRGILVCYLALGPLGSACSRAEERPALSQPNLRETIIRQVRDDKVLLADASFGKEKFRDTEYFAYFLGGIPRFDDGASLPPLRYPFELQCRVIAIERALTAKMDRDFWKPYLARAESIVGEQLRTIREHKGGRKSLVEKLQKLDSDADRLLDSAARKAAAALRLPSKKTTLYGAGATFKVSFSTDPNGGTVYYLSAMDYDLFSQSRNEDVPASWKMYWNEAQAAVQIGGNYYFRVSWDGTNRVRKTGKYVIDEDKKLEFRPE